MLTRRPQLPCKWRRPFASCTHAEQSPFLCCKIIACLDKFWTASGINKVSTLVRTLWVIPSCLPSGLNFTGPSGCKYSMHSKLSYASAFVFSISSMVEHVWRVLRLGYTLELAFAPPAAFHFHEQRYPMQFIINLRGLNRYLDNVCYIICCIIYLHETALDYTV